MAPSPYDTALPSAVKLFVVAHLLALAGIGMVAALVGEAHESHTAAQSSYLRLVPISPVTTAPEGPHLPAQGGV